MVSEPVEANSIPSPLAFDAMPDQPVRLRHQGLTIGRNQDRGALTLPRDEGDPAGLRRSKPDPMIQELHLLDQAGIGKSLRRQVVLGCHGSSPTRCVTDLSTLPFMGRCTSNGAEANETRSEE